MSVYDIFMEHMRPAECVASCIEAPTTMIDDIEERAGLTTWVHPRPNHPPALARRDLGNLYRPNDLSGPIPAEIGQLTKLTFL